MTTTLGAFTGGALIALAASSIARAQSPADFYKGKTLELQIGYSRLAATIFMRA